jgi:hypothetical protein
MMSGGIDTTFWGDRLEVGTELIQKQLEDDEFMEKWSTLLGPRRRSLLLDELGVDDTNGKGEARAAILEHREELLPFLLVDAAAAGKRTYAILEVARAKLKAADIERCRVKPGEDKFDRAALMWRLYLNAPENLEIVFRLDQRQRRGFARMVLKPVPKTNGIDVGKFFRKTNLQKILDEYERENKTLRQSHCADVLHDGGNYQVFIKRDTKESFVSHGEKNTFGFEHEWIILDIEPDLRRVNICSISPEVPLLLANRIASKFFGKDVTYENDSIETDAEKVAKFLDALAKQSASVPLVEITAKNSGLDGAPQLRLNDQQNESVAPAVLQFAASFGNPLDHPADIESIKVYALKKRVKMIFEAVNGDEDQFVVRYADQPLNGKERREFEQMMEQEHDITVLSTEKRRAK